MQQSVFMNRGRVTSEVRHATISFMHPLGAAADEAQLQQSCRRQRKGRHEVVRFSVDMILRWAERQIIA